MVELSLTTNEFLALQLFVRSAIENNPELFFDSKSSGTGGYKVNVMRAYAKMVRKVQTM